MFSAERLEFGSEGALLHLPTRVNVPSPQKNTPLPATSRELLEPYPNPELRLPLRFSHLGDVGPDRADPPALTPLQGTHVPCFQRIVDLRDHPEVVAPFEPARNTDDLPDGANGLYLSPIGVEHVQHVEDVHHQFDVSTPDSDRLRHAQIDLVRPRRPAGVAVEHPEIFSRLVLNTTTVPRGNSVVGSIWVAWGLLLRWVS